MIIILLYDNLIYKENYIRKKKVKNNRLSLNTFTTIIYFTNNFTIILSLYF